SSRLSRMMPDYISDTKHFWVSLDGTKYCRVQDISYDHLSNLIPFVASRVREGQAIEGALDREGKKVLKRLKDRHKIMLEEVQRRFERRIR
ncbi:hypothetical protein LCGC14_2868370, partial [marine sediment metagenome]